MNTEYDDLIMSERHMYARPRTALVLYGTETGTSQDLATETCRILERARFDAGSEDFDNVSAQSLSAYGLVVFVLSTTGQGDFPSNARKFWTSLLRKRLAASFLSDVKYALVGLGDSSYPKFNWAARKLHKRVQQLGAESLMDPCEADEQGEDSTDGAFISWTNAFKSMLTSTFPLPAGVEPIPDEQPLPSRWTLALAQEGKPLNGDHNDRTPRGDQPIPQPSSGLCLKVTLLQNERVTPLDHWQDVRHMKFKSDTSTAYLPGDVLAIKPENMPSDVQHLLTLMEWSDVADNALHLQQNRVSTRSKHLLYTELPIEESFTLRQLLTNNLDINAIPRRSFFGAIAHYTDDDMHRERLLEFTDPQYLDEYYDYATRPRRSMLEILQEFDSVRIPWEEAINVFPLLRPRQFSIASGGALKHGGTTFELLVAIVKYKTIIRRIREGVCTRYLADLPNGTTINATFKTEGRLHTLPQLKQTNYLLIGAGTGIAPLRAMIYEKEEHPSSGSNTLIFGCRNSGADYFFAGEWQKMTQSSKADDDHAHALEVITAFSRDQTQKIYVQDRIRECARRVRELLLRQNATIVVCGSSGQMPKAVRQALVDVLKQTEEDGAGGMESHEAEKFLDQMEKLGRYKQETW